MLKLFGLCVLELDIFIVKGFFVKVFYIFQDDDSEFFLNVVLSYARCFNDLQMIAMIHFSLALN